MSKFDVYGADIAVSRSFAGTFLDGHTESIWISDEYFFLSLSNS